MKKLLILLLVALACNSHAQKKYEDDLKTFQKNYIESHEVVKGNDRVYFRFFPINKKYWINAKFDLIKDTIGFDMKTSAGTTKHYFRYGKASFTIKDTGVQLFIYQSEQLMKTEEYKDYLFIPFTDNTSGDASYGSGRYIDIRMKDIVNGRITFDFNKAYNPYCAYASGFHCPVPPKENHLKVAILAGEKSFAKPGH